MAANSEIRVECADPVELVEGLVENVRDVGAFRVRQLEKPHDEVRPDPGFGAFGPELPGQIIPEQTRPVIQVPQVFMGGAQVTVHLPETAFR